MFVFACFILLLFAYPCHVMSNAVRISSNHDDSKHAGFEKQMSIIETETPMGTCDSEPHDCVNGPTRFYHTSLCIWEKLFLNLNI